MIQLNLSSVTRIICFPRDQFSVCYLGHAAGILQISDDSQLPIFNNKRIRLTISSTDVGRI